MWKCPDCGNENNDEITQCVCGTSKDEVQNIVHIDEANSTPIDEGDNKKDKTGVSLPPLPQIPQQVQTVETPSKRMPVGAIVAIFVLGAIVIIFLMYFLLSNSSDSSYYDDDDYYGDTSSYSDNTYEDDYNEVNSSVYDPFSDYAYNTIYFVNRFSTDGIYVRSGPGKENRDIYYIKKGDRNTKLEYLGSAVVGSDGYDWYYVQIPDGSYGYVREDVVDYEME